MFVTHNQIFVFIASVAFGCVSGVLFSVASLFKFPVKNIIVRVIPDVVAFSLTSVLFVAFSFASGFPNFRAYMILGVFVGIALYMKSFNILLAKFCEKIYNVLKRKCERRKKSNNAVKRSKNAGRKNDGGKI